MLLFKSNYAKFKGNVQQLQIICYYRDRNRPKVVDHRHENLTPNRREEIQQRNKQQFETTSARNPFNRDRFSEYTDDSSRQDSVYANQPLAKISFGRLPYPVGNSS